MMGTLILHDVAVSLPGISGVEPFLTAACEDRWPGESAPLGRLDDVATQLSNAARARGLWPVHMREIAHVQIERDGADGRCGLHAALEEGFSVAPRNACGLVLYAPFSPVEANHPAGGPNGGGDPRGGIGVLLARPEAADPGLVAVTPFGTNAELSPEWSAVQHIESIAVDHCLLVAGLPPLPTRGTPGPRCWPWLAELIALSKVALALSRWTVPAWPAGAKIPASRAEAATRLAPPQPTPWIPPPDGGPMRAMVILREGHGCLGVCEVSHSPVQSPVPRARFADRDTVLVPVAADSVDALCSSLHAVEDGAWEDAHALARDAHDRYREQSNLPLAAALVGDDVEALKADAAFFRSLLETGTPMEREWRTPRGSVFAPRPVCGQIAFVYPGFGSAYSGAGRMLTYLLPFSVAEAQRRFGRQNLQALQLAELYRVNSAAEDGELTATAEDICNATVALSILYTIVARDAFGLRPSLALGYSIGELSMMFALGAWNDVDGYLAGLAESKLFSHRLAGHMDVATQRWQELGLADDEAGPWISVLIGVEPARAVSAAASEPAAWVALINSPHEVVLAGHPSAVQRVVAVLGADTIPLKRTLPLHCPVAAEASAALAVLTDHPLTPKPEAAFYTSALGAPCAYTREAVADALLQGLTRRVDFPRLVRQAHDDGARIFVEIGPRGICTRWVEASLSGLPHVAVALNRKGVSEDVALLRALALLVAHRTPIKTDLLFEAPVGRPAETTASVVIPAAQSAAPVLASDEVVALIVEMLATKLRTTPQLIDPAAPLVSLGLDSLAATELATAVESRLEIHIDLADFIAAGSVNGIAELIGRRAAMRALMRVDGQDGAKFRVVL